MPEDEKTYTEHHKAFDQPRNGDDFSFAINSWRWQVTICSDFAINCVISFKPQAAPYQSRFRHRHHSAAMVEVANLFIKS